MPDPAPAVPAATLPGGAAGGSVLPILQHPDPRLRDTCNPAALMPGSDLRRLATDMLTTMYDARGRGLAAPQVGVAARFFVMDAGWKDGRPCPRIVLDPCIVWRSDAVDVAEEQCLSIPGHPVRVQRPTAIRMTWFDLDGAAQDARLDGAEARIAQHEADHLDGILILDHTP